MVLAGEQPPAPKGAPIAGIHGNLFTSGGPGGHILGLKQLSVAVESAMGIGNVLGATQPSVFERFLLPACLQLAGSAGGRGGGVVDSLQLLSEVSR